MKNPVWRGSFIRLFDCTYASSDPLSSTLVLWIHHYEGGIIKRFATGRPRTVTFAGMAGGVGWSDTDSVLEYVSSSPMSSKTLASNSTASFHALISFFSDDVDLDSIRSSRLYIRSQVVKIYLSQETFQVFVVVIE